VREGRRAPGAGGLHHDVESRVHPESLPQYARFADQLAEWNKIQCLTGYIAE
jgi:hypothetical protein